MLKSKNIIMDVDQPDSLIAKAPDSRIFSLRSFIFSVLNQSPITVKEKLDLIYDITDMSNKSVDGIDTHDAHQIYETILMQHLYYLPSNELRTQVENVFNKGHVSGITGAYWTSKFTSEIKFDMTLNGANGFIMLQDFLDGAA